MVGQSHLRIPFVHHALDLPKVEMSQRHLVKVRGWALADRAILLEFIFFNGDCVSCALPARGDGGGLRHSRELRGHTHHWRLAGTLRTAGVRASRGAAASSGPSRASAEATLLALRSPLLADRPAARGYAEEDLGELQHADWAHGEQQGDT